MSQSSVHALLVPAEEAMRLLGGISRKSLYSWTRPRGPIPCIKLGARVLYSVRALEAFIAEQEAKAGRGDS